MTTESVIQRRNLESEMLFLRQEHAKTLKGLHEEIKVLQKRCTDLTFKLTMHGLHTEDTTELEAKVKQLETELDAAKSNETHLLEGLTKERNKIKELEIQLKYQAIKHNQEVASKEKELNSLRADLDYKADYIGHLSTELHKAKIQQKLEENLNIKSKENVFHVVPVPPKNAPGSAGGGGRHSRRSHMQKSRSDEVDINEAWHSSSPSSGRSSATLRNHGSRLNSPHQPGMTQTNSQELSEQSTSSSSPPQFLNRDHQHHHHPHNHHHHHHRRHTGGGSGGGGGGSNNNNNHSSNSHNGNNHHHHHHHNNNNNNNLCSSIGPSPSLLIKSKPTPRLLPPIRQNGGQIQSQNLRHVYVKNVVRPHCFRAQSCECDGPQVETLAVDPIGRLESGWRNSNQPKSAEYK